MDETQFVFEKPSESDTESVADVVVWIKEECMEVDSQEPSDKDNENEDKQNKCDKSLVSNTIQEISLTVGRCVQCKQCTLCPYGFTTVEGECILLCQQECVTAFVNDHPGFTVTCKKHVIKEIMPLFLTCFQCKDKSTCYFSYNLDGKDTNYCSLKCLYDMIADEKDKFEFKRRQITFEEITPKKVKCSVCNELNKCYYEMTRYGKQNVVCNISCIKILTNREISRYVIKKKIAHLETPRMVRVAREERERTFLRCCNQCTLVLQEKEILTWQIMDFCDEVCFERYQNKIGSRCANCLVLVQHTSLGKYCVRFGYDIRQFCNSACLEEFRICGYCQTDISVSHQGFLAPVGDKCEFKDFCSQLCMEKFDQISKNPIPQPVLAKCAVCSLKKATAIEIEVDDDGSQWLCSDPCFVVFKLNKNIFPDRCRWCKKYFERKLSKCYTIYEDGSPHCFCSMPCMNVYMLNSRYIMPCKWCKATKENYDMIRVRANGQTLMMCSLSCLNLHKASVNAVSSIRKINNSVPIRALQVTRTPQGSLSTGNEELTVERTEAEILRPWRPQNVADEVSIEFSEAPGMTSSNLFPDVANEDITGDISDAPLAETFAVDSGSEAEEEEFTSKLLIELLEEDPIEEADAEDLTEHFEWRDDYSTFAGRREKFLEKVGSTIVGTSPLGIFSQLWDQPLIETIVTETNRYAWQTIAHASESENGISSGSRLNLWVETSVPEVYRLIGVLILMGMSLMGRVEEYWSKGILTMPEFRSIMSKDRYLLLMRFIHFIDNDYIIGGGEDRKIAKINPVVSYLNEKFQAVYSPRQELSIEESLLLCKGRPSWVQCTRAKAPRLGIKSYELCEAVSGYVLNMLIYTGKTTTTSRLVDGREVVLHLSRDYLGKGYTLFMEKFYNSLELCRFLKRNRTDVVGTLNRRRQQTPNDIMVLDERGMLRGAVVGRHCGDISVTAWRGEKLVTMMSTYHNLVEDRRAGRDMKPKVIEEYNRYIGGIELKDENLAMYLLERKCKVKFYIKVFKRLLNISILNSYIIYCCNIGHGAKMTHRQFRYALAAELIAKYGKSSDLRSSRKTDVYCERLDLTFNHFPAKAENASIRTSTKQNKYKRSRCVSCLAKGKRTMTDIFCSHCNVYLCVGPCWRVFHTFETV